MIQTNPNDKQADQRGEPIDMWCWLRLLGWRSPLFEGSTADGDGIEGDRDEATSQEASESESLCRAGFTRLEVNPNALASSLSIEDERALGWAIVNDGCTRAKELLFFFGLPTLARAVDAYEGRGLTTAELIDHGARGLRSAVDDFDPAPGVRFSTIASWWIKQSFKEALKERRTALVTA